MTEKQEKFIEIKKTIEQSKNILLAAHVDVDGDALGSMLALSRVLNCLGKKSIVFCSSVPQGLKFLPGSADVKDNIEEENFDLVIGLDHGNLNRLDIPENLRCAISDKQLVFIAIDHHIVNDQNDFLGIIDSNAAATCEIIYQMINYFGFEIDKDIATCLLCGIFTDTGSFRHSNTTAETLKIAGDLLLRGAALNKIVKFTFNNSQSATLKTWAHALDKLKFDENSGIAVSDVSYDELKEIGSNFEELNGFSSLMSAIAEAKVGLFLKKKGENKFEGSLRSRDFDVASLAKKLGGGGHRLAAGFKTDKEMEEILSTIKSLLNNNSEANLQMDSQVFEGIGPVAGELT